MCRQMEQSGVVQTLEDNPHMIGWFSMLSIYNLLFHSAETGSEDFATSPIQECNTASGWFKMSCTTRNDLAIGTLEQVPSR
jgi:hypothetical protein